ncbi:hypothetical protein Tco_0649639 [Tanacetum coccineum]
MMNDIDSHQEKWLSSLRTEFQQQQDDISIKLNTLLKICSERFINNPTHNTTYANVLTSCQFEGTKPRNKEVIKSPTKLLAPKYHEQPSSITIDEKTPPSRRVHFVNTTTLVKKEKESRDTTPREHEGLTSEVDDEVGSNELEKEEEDDLEYFNTFPSMKELEYHECIIDHDLGEIAFGKPFIEETGLAYDKEEGMIVFRRNDEKITFKMPHRMEMFRHVDLKDMNTEPIPPFVLGNKNEPRKVYYSNSLIIDSCFAIAVIAPSSLSSILRLCHHDSDDVPLDSRRGRGYSDGVSKAWS